MDATEDAKAKKTAGRAAETRARRAAGAGVASAEGTGGEAVTRSGVAAKSEAALAWVRAASRAETTGEDAAAGTATGTATGPGAGISDGTGAETAAGIADGIPARTTAKASARLASVSAAADQEPNAEAAAEAAPEAGPEGAKEAVAEITVVLQPDADGLAAAVVFLRAGRLVAFPTETVYGLGGDAVSDLAVARIYAAKGRPRFNPLIAHVSDMAMARRLAVFDARAEALAARFWPGPLTLVLPVRDAGLSPYVTAELPTVAVRLPAHPVARALIAAFGGPIAAPSANPSGRVSPTRAGHVLDGLSGRIAAVIDGGPCAVGLESTILGVFDQIELLRPGGVSSEEIEALVGPLVTGPQMIAGQGTRPNAPGQLASHYAPDAPLRLHAFDVRPLEVRLGFGAGPRDLNLSPCGDLIEAAANLFHLLREADRTAAGRTIAVAPIPETGLGRAINDRLRRAAAPR